MHRNQIWKWGFAAWGVVVFLISASTTFAFFMTYFSGWIPEGILDPWLSAILSGVAGMLLFDVAAVLWLYQFLRNAASSEQRAIAIGMTMLDFVFAAAASIAYLGLTATGDLALSGVAKDTIGLIALGVVILGVVINFGSTLAYTRFDPVTKEDVREAERRDRVDRAYAEAQKKLDAEVARQLGLEIDDLSRQIVMAQTSKLTTGFYDVETRRFETESPHKKSPPSQKSTKVEPGKVAELIANSPPEIKRCPWCGEVVEGRRKFCNSNHRKYYNRSLKEE